MALPKETVEKVVTRKYHAELDDNYIKSLFGLEDVRNVRVYVRVPGGGDWCNENLDIEADCPVIVEYEIVEEY